MNPDPLLMQFLTEPSTWYGLGLLLISLWVVRTERHKPVRLVLSEQDLHIDSPIQLSGRPDEVYVDRQGCLVPAETKTRKRARIHESDRIQLSAYGLLLRYASHDNLPGGTPRPVATYGWVRVVTPHGTRWLRTGLLSEADVIALAERRYALEAGRVQPTPAHHPALCRRCDYRHQCPAARS